MKPTEALRVLIFSANDGLAQTMRAAVRGMNIRDVEIASTPRLVMDAFSHSKPDVLIVDIEGVDNDTGISLVRFLRRWEKSPDRRIPIVATSQCRDLPTISAAVNAGINEYAVIPVSGDTLLKRIVSAVQSDRPFIDHPSYVGPCRRRRQLDSYAGPERRAATAIAAE
jgi:two-component system, chemotaxis family, chemotaxis protein CheY